NDRGILIENFDPKEMETSRVINLSELCYGLGKVISDELQAFFKESTEDICNELGFQTMLIVFGIPTNKMNELPYKYNDRGILIENFDPKEMETSRVINLSELCYGLGK
ncbi:hypothetical protein WCN65_15035, partial [Staphylococcus aureus]